MDEGRDAVAPRDPRRSRPRARAVAAVAAVAESLRRAHARGRARAELPAPLLALAALLAARQHRHAPLGAALMLLVWAWAAGRRIIFVCALMIATSALSARAFDGLLPPDGMRRVDGVAVLLSDPAPARGGWRADVRVGRVRLDASFPGAAGGAVQHLVAGERVRIAGRVRRYGADRTSSSLSRHLRARLQVDHVAWAGGAPWPLRVANNIRALINASAQRMRPDDRALFLGFVLGDDRAQSDADRADFRAAGLTHLLAVSGQNVSFVLALTRPLQLRLRLPARTLFVLLVLLLFATMTRWEPSVLRAVVMAALAVLSGAAGRPLDPLRRVSLAVTGLLLLDPLLAWSVGFALSAGACVGIACLRARLDAVLPMRLPASVRGALATTLAAQLGTMPFLLLVFHDHPVASIPANLLAEPAAEPVMVWGTLVGLIGGTLRPHLPWLAALLHMPTVLAMRWIRFVAARFGWAGLGTWNLTLSAAVVSAIVVVRVHRRARARRLDPSHRGRSGRGTGGGVAGGGARALLATATVVALLVVVRGRVGGVDWEAVRTPALGARLQRLDGATVLELDGRADAVRVLDALRIAGVRRLDVVWARSSAARRTAGTVAARIRPRHLVSGSGRYPQASSR